MLSFTKSQHRQSQAFFKSRFGMVDPGVPVAPGDSPEDVQALRKAVNACQAIILEKAHVLFEFNQRSQIESGWIKIKDEVGATMRQHAEHSPGITANKANFLRDEILLRGGRLFEHAFQRSPKTVDLEDALHFRNVRTVSRTLSKAVLGMSEADLANQSFDLSRRFGLSSLRLAGEDSMSPREKSKIMERATNDLARACRNMGIVEQDFGGGSLCLVVDPYMSSLHGYAGYQKNLGTFGMEIGFNPGQPCVSGTLVHEYVHKLDNELGEKALNVFNNNHGIQGPLKQNNSVLFSNLTAEQQSILPLAKEGIEKIFSTLGTTDSKHVDTLEAFDAAAHTLVAKVMGVSRMVNVSTPEMRSWIQATRDDDDSLLRGLASMVTRMPVGAMVHQFFDDHLKNTGKEHAFVDMLRSQGIDHQSEQVGVAFKKIHPTVQKLAASIHPSLPEGMAPSTFLKASVTASARMAKGASWEREDVLSTPHELLARLVGRPSSLSEMSTAFANPFRASPLGPEKLKELNEGLMKMLLADGVRLTEDGPRLSSGHENAVARTVTPIFKAVQYAAHAAIFLGQKTALSPVRNARQQEKINSGV